MRIIILALVIWGLLFWAVYALGSALIEKNRSSAKRQWSMEEQDYDHKKWTFRFYTVAFFVGIPLLVILALFLN